MNKLFAVNSNGIEEVKILQELPEYYVLDDMLMGDSLPVVWKSRINPGIDEGSIGRCFYTALKPALQYLRRVILIEEKKLDLLKRQVEVHSLAT